tara:strand:+ start:1005 stop:1895 length:891 start_codon:yes stop_codon:yes gene_type:complete
MRSIAIANQKGGVGKTTTSVNLAVALSRLQKKVCLIDLDPQAHATLHVGVSPTSTPCSAYDVLVNNQPLAAALVQAQENLWVVPSHLDLSVAEMTLAGRPGRESILRERLKSDSVCSGSHQLANTQDDKEQSQFDYIIIDCPPSLGLLSLNAMAAVDEVLLPLQPHFLALHGLSKLLETIELSAEHINPRLRLLGVALCLYEAGTRLAAEVGRDVESFFAEAGKGHPSWKDARVFETKIRRNIRLAEAPSFGQSIFEYANDSNGASDYHNLASEVDAAVLPLWQPGEPCERNKMAA